MQKPYGRVSWRVSRFERKQAVKQGPCTHLVVRYDRVDLHKAEAVHAAPSFAEAKRVCAGLIQAAARLPGSTALYAVRQYSSLSLYQRRK
jgi:hypothetical protein